MTHKVNKKAVQEAFKTLDPKGYIAYLEHFRAIKPSNEEEVFQRFLFSFLSVQTPWQSNVNLYKKLQGYDWDVSRENLVQIFKNEGVGLQNNRAGYLYDFVSKYKKDAQFFIKKEEEGWLDYRDRLNKKVKGLAKAKLSFTFELLYPETSELVCFDRHMLARVFNVEKTKYGIDCSYTQYKEFEKVWKEEAWARSMAPAIARLFYWDKIQGFENSLFWSEVFV